VVTVSGLAKVAILPQNFIRSSKVQI